MNTILVTGGCGFIGANFIRFLFENEAFSGVVVNVDKLTYAGNPENLRDVEKNYPKRYVFKHGDIADKEIVNSIFQEFEPQYVVNFAAESHVDRSILGPYDFVKSNIIGTFTLLEAAQKYWKNRKQEEQDAINEK